MSDERRPEDGPPEDEEDKGLGLTEEFKRLEDEISREGRSDVRFDETDSSEWVAPVERREPSGETDEWATPETLGDISGDAEEAEGGEDAEPTAGAEDAGADAPAEAEPEAADASANAAEEGDATPEEEGDGSELAAEEPAEPAESAEGAEDEQPAESAGDEQPAEDAELATAVSPAAAAAEAADAPATEHTVVRDRPLAPLGAGGGGGTSGGFAPITDEDIQDKTPALWWRFMTASVMIIVATATAVALSGLLAFNSVLADFTPIKGVPKGAIDEVKPGEPFTILIVGSDKRSNTPGDPGRSDTTMLLRVDAQDQVLSLFSLPRDLKVDIPGYGTAKLNEAYTEGGIKKTLETVKDLTGLDINYVVNVDFQGFADAVDAINCVYVDVDRKYFNDNSTAYSEAEQYAAIDINAGYQRLCGLNALDYVRYRHTDSDFTRAARQQDFLRNARAQVPVSEVLPIIGGDKGSDLLDIFTKYTATTIETPAQLISMLRSFISVRDVPVKEVHFNGQDSLENGIAYVTASQEDIDKAVNEFLGEEDSSGGPDSGPSKKDKDKGGNDEDKKSEDKDKQEEASNADVTSTANDPCNGADKVAAFGRTSARRLKFPVYVPTVMVPGSCYEPDSRQYRIKDNDDNKQDAYKLVLNLNSSQAAGEYYGVMGTEWSDPPILEKKSETITMGDRDYDLYYDGDRLRLVAFHVDDNSYWVSNTLLQTLSDDQMLAIAKSMEEAHGG
ncbi:MAG: LCP family protein [Solirubrobacterales bacterium]